MKREKSFRVLIIEGADRGDSIPLHGTTILLGSKTPSPAGAPAMEGEERVLFTEPSVSRVHAILEWDRRENTYRISHWSRTGSTMVNQLSVDRKILRNGDHIKMGNLVIRFMEVPDELPGEKSAEAAIPPGQDFASPGEQGRDTLDRFLHSPVRKREHPSGTARHRGGSNDRASPIAPPGKELRGKEDISPPGQEDPLPGRGGGSPCWKSAWPSSC